MEISARSDTRIWTQGRHVVLPDDWSVAGDLPPLGQAGSLYWMGLPDKAGGFGNLAGSKLTG
jgi:hypothetical protein